MDSYIGSLLIFGGNFTIKNYAMCNGQLLSIASNTALFSILGTTYGGNGVQTFALPDLRGRVPVHYGQGPGLSPYVLGQASGSETTTLLISNMPAHNHLINVDHKTGNNAEPSGAYLAKGPTISGSDVTIYTNVAPDTTLAPTSVSLTGGSIPINNLQPYLALNYQITLFGIFPSRN